MAALLINIIKSKQTSVSKINNKVVPDFLNLTL